MSVWFELTLHEDSTWRPQLGIGPNWKELENLGSKFLCVCVSEAIGNIDTDFRSCDSSQQLRMILALSPVSCLSKVPGKSDLKKRNVQNINLKGKKQTKNNHNS